MTNLSKTLLKASFIGTFAEQMLLPIWSRLVDRVGGGLLDAGIGFAVFSIATGIVVVALGSTTWYEQRVKWMVFLGFLVAGLAELCFIFVTNRWELYAVQTVIGISVGLLNPAWDALYSDDSQESHSRRWSFWTGGISFVVGVAALVGAAIVNAFGWTVLFLTMAGFNVVAMYYAWQVTTDTRAKW